MKTVFFVRHAKSSWSDQSLADIERPLNNRGLRDAPFMAALLKGKAVEADQLISSPANRAFTTATYFAEALGVQREDILVRNEIYEAWPEDIINIVQSAEEAWSTILIFGHNPTMTSIANIFSKEYIANVPTCGIVKVVAPVDNWSMFRRENAKMEQFYYPKQYFT
ncbi:MAG: histidine phosphatase family protein [Bacteroidota bacterium]